MHNMQTISQLNKKLKGDPLKSDLLDINSVCVFCSAYGGLLARWSAKKCPISLTIQQLSWLGSEKFYIQ